MIQYVISRRQLEQKIEEYCPGWLDKARTRTATFRTLGRYEERSTIWSDVKAVYVMLQQGKCAYCERQLESEEYGLIEHDLEHFRPKKKAKPWKLNRNLKKEGIALTLPAAGTADPGYHLLAYHILNYSAACKTCNSRLKSDYFPIEGVRASGSDDPVILSSEMPLLVNPVGDFDDDPASLISFHGLSPQASVSSGYRRKRGLVTIAFFHLDDPKRKYLFRERASIIVSLYSFMENAAQAASPAVKTVFENLIDIMTRPSAPHANCARCFRTLYEQDRAQAGELFVLATKYLESISV